MLLVYRPEAAANPVELHTNDPFDGVEVFGIFSVDDWGFVEQTVEEEHAKHPAWKFYTDDLGRGRRRKEPL